MAITGSFIQRNILCKMPRDVFLGFFYGNKMVFFQSLGYKRIGPVVSNRPQHLFYYFHHQLIDLQPGARAAKGQLQDIKMKELRFRIGIHQGGMTIVVTKKRAAAPVLAYFIGKRGREFKNRTLVGYCVRMGHSMLVARFGHQYAAVVGIQHPAKNIKKKISFPYKTDAKIFRQFRL